MTIKYTDVFVPGGYPKLTYNPRLELQLENRLSEAKNNLCKLVTITGQTKAGKTVLTKKVFDPRESVWVDGGMVSEFNVFWEIIIEQLELFNEVEEEDTNETASKLGGKLSCEVGFLIAKGTSEISGERETTRGTSRKGKRTVSPQVAAIEGLRETRTPLIVDDFHYIDKEVQAKIVRALKPLVFEGLPIVIIAIPHRRYDALKVEKEMTGRIAQIHIPSWGFEELIYVATKGFGLLNLQIDSSLVFEMASQAIGSPHLMQEFCRGLCKEASLTYVEKTYKPRIPEDVINRVFGESAEAIGRPIFEKLARGPRQRTDRQPRELKKGGVVDIYELVLHSLAFLKPALVSIEYEELRAAIKEVSFSQPPQLQEVARVLKHMSTIAATDQSSAPVIEFEDEEKRLHITDPFFAFYLRWGDLSPKNYKPS